MAPKTLIFKTGFFRWKFGSQRVKSENDWLSFCLGQNKVAMVVEVVVVTVEVVEVILETTSRHLRPNPSILSLFFPEIPF